jgi:hypothetical protein
VMVHGGGLKFHLRSSAVKNSSIARFPRGLTA